MIDYKELTDDEARFTIENKEFPETLTNAAQHVAIIATQSWCSQWIEMKQWIQETKNPTPTKVAVYYYEYDTKDIFDEFRTMKERMWNNHEVPYIRYYTDGTLVADSNYCSQEQFFARFK